MFKGHCKWVVPILCMLLLTPFTPWIDLSLERMFYHSNSGHFTNNFFLDFVYDYLTLPADIVVVLASLLYLLSFVSSRWKKWRKACLLLVLTLGIGAGVIIHAVFKDHWGRPRPKQVIEFGGMQPFRPFYEPNFFHQPEPSKSFPCGHCSTGFYFFCFTVLGLRYKNYLMIIAGTLTALLLGGILSYARLAQGGHFFSDTIMTALIMWLSALVLDWLIFSTVEKKS